MDDVQDQPVIRNAFGFWQIPGTSLAGSLRALGERLDAELTPEMFGDQQGEKSVASLIWCADGLVLDYDGKPALAKTLAGQECRIECENFVRDHVRIDLDSGAGVDGGKFDSGFVPAGSRFLLEFRCDGWDKELMEQQKAYFDALVGQLLAGNLTIGGKTGLGYGQYKVLESAYRELDLRTPEGMQAWLDLGRFDLPAKVGGSPLVPPEASQPPAGNGLEGWLEIPLDCDGPVLIGGGFSHSDADMVFALTPGLDYEHGQVIWNPVLPSSSLRGIFRHAVYSVLQALGAVDSEEILNSLFGFIRGDQGQQGKVSFADCALQNSAKKQHYQFVQHVAIDRFTGGTVDGALFSEEPYWNEGSQAVLRIQANGLQAHEAALFFHALFDLLEGSLAVGSGVNRGNGRLKLSGWQDDPAKAAQEIKGEMTWNGEPLLANGLENLKKFAPEWDAALKAKL